MVVTVSEFVSFVNQTLDVAYPYISVRGEISNFKVSRNRWVYFDLKDEAALIRCFMTVYGLRAPLEDGMIVEVSGSPKLHPLYNFTFNVDSVRGIGEGTLKRQADILAAKLAEEGLFSEDRKRRLPSLPRRVALITAHQSAAYADFIKISKARWAGSEIIFYDVLVQGERAAAAIEKAINTANQATDMPDVVVLIRGGGSAEDLAVFNEERVVRTVAGSRAPMLVAIGHESDTVLAELAADVRASTPSNAAEILWPDKDAEKMRLNQARLEMNKIMKRYINFQQNELKMQALALKNGVQAVVFGAEQSLDLNKRLLKALDPRLPLQRGYTLVRSPNGTLVTSKLKATDHKTLTIEFKDGEIKVQRQREDI